MYNKIALKKVWFSHGSGFAIVKIPLEFNNTPQVPGLKKIILDTLPEIKYHRCRNSFDYSFEEELSNTEVAHVLEHILIELISRRDEETQKIIGWTKWNWIEDPRGYYQIEVEYANKAIFLRSLADSLELLNILVEKCLDYKIDESFCIAKSNA